MKQRTHAWKQVLAVCLTVVMLLSVAPVGELAGLDLGLFQKAEAAGSRVANYSATAGVEYARRYALSYNKEWYFYESGGDCANFLSQALFAGGVSMTGRWHCYDSNSRAYCMSDEYTWIRANTLKNYLVDLGGTLIHNPSASDFSLGDAVFYDWTGNGVMNHSAIVTAIDNGVPKVSAHSTPENQSKLDAHWTYGHNSSCCYLVKLYGALCDNNYARSYDIYRVSGNGSKVIGVYRASDWANIGSLKRFIIRVPDSNPGGWSRFNFDGTDSYVNLGEMTKIGRWDKIQVSHLMSAWYTKQAPTCTQKGIEERKCSRCGYTEQRETGLGGRHQNIVPATCLSPEYCTACGTIISQALGHAMGDWTYTKSPTCLEGGAEKRVCERCGYTEERDVDALGHNYEGTVTLAGCVTTGASYYKCTRCGDIQYENESWSAYSVIDTTDPIYAEFLNNSDLCRSRTEYRYRTKEYRTGSSNTLNGYTLRTDVTNPTYSAWGNWGNWQETPITKTDLVDVGTRQVEQTALSYWVVDNSDWVDSLARAQKGNTYYQVDKWVTTTSVYEYNPYNSSTMHYWSDELGADKYYPLVITGTRTITQYRSRTRTATYYFEKWSDWSSWKTTPVTGNDNTSVETRTTYSFRQDALDHDWGDTITVEPMCHEDGYTGKVCRRCGAKMTLSTIPALGDNWGEWKLISEEDGVRTYRHDCINFPDENGVCACGHYEIKSEHDCKYAPVKTVEPTCTEDGYTLYRCTVHENASECHAQGSVYEYQDDEVPALGHEKDNNWYVVTPATCEEDGLECCKCIRHDNGVTCDKVFDHKIEKTGHDYQLIERVLPTCTDDGYEYYECSNNGEHNYKVITEKLGHDMGEEIHYLNGETSTDETACGEHKWVSDCRRDGCDYKEERYQFVDHTFGEEKTIESTCVADGIVYHNCENCGYYEEIRRIDPLGHDFVPDDSRSYDATCTDEGLDANTCSRCKTPDDYIIPAIGHAASPLDEAYETSDDKMELVSSVPNVCGNGTVDTYRCTHINNGERCDYTVVIGEANDHTLGDYIITKEATCTEYGYQHKECQNDGCTYRTKDEEIEPLGHLPGDAYIEKASCTEQGARKIDCERCSQTLEEYVIDARNHDFSAWTTVTDATCETNGLEKRSCLHTDETDAYTACTYEETRSIPALEHDWGAWAAFSDNEHQRVCKRDANHKETEPHIWSKSSSTDADCTNAGSITWRCDVCGAQKTEPVDPNGHQLVKTEAVAAKCLEDGNSEYFTCTVCGKFFADSDAQTEIDNDSWVIPALGHNPGTPIIEKANCLENGLATTTCTRCQTTLNEEPILARGELNAETGERDHIWSDWEVVKPLTANEPGLERRVCLNQDETEEYEACAAYETRPINGHQAIFMAKDQNGEYVEVGRVNFAEGTTAISAPDFENYDDRFVAYWPDFSDELAKNEDFVVKAVYQPKGTIVPSDLETDKTVKYVKSDATVTLSAFAETLNVRPKLGAEPVDIVLVLDHSKSMVDNKMSDNKTTRYKALQNSAKAFVENVFENAEFNNVNHRIAVVAYNKTAYAFNGSSWVPTSNYKPSFTSVLNNKAGILQILDAPRQNSSGTCTDSGLDAARDLLKMDGSRKQIVVLFTDGEPTSYSIDGASGFSISVANRAISISKDIKQNYNAPVYCIGVTKDAKPGDPVNLNPSSTKDKLNTFLHAVSSNYPNATELKKIGDRISSSEENSYYVAATSTDELTGLFNNIVSEQITNNITFQNLTIVDTVSKYFTLTQLQESALRQSLLETYGVTNDRITVTRNDDGTTTICIANISPKSVEKNGKSGYGITVSYEVTANENAINAGTYSAVNASGEDGQIACIMKDGEVYAEFTLEEIGSFTVNDPRYIVRYVVEGETIDIVDIESSMLNQEVETPNFALLKLAEENSFVVSDQDTVIHYTYLNEQHTVTWIVAEETRTDSYYSGAIIRVPEVNAAEGYLFAGWDGEVPFRMGSNDLIFVAKFVAHTHDHFKTVSGSCDTGATYTYTCSCGHSYTVTAEPTAHVFVANVAYHEDVAYASVTCSACGKVYQEETAIAYQAAASDRADAEFFDLTLQAGSTPVQPDGTIIVRVALEEDNLLNADKLYAFRIEDGGKTEVQVEKDGSFALLYLDHFSYYMITDKPEDQAQAPAFQSVSCMFNGHSYTDTVTSPTCTEQGYTIHTCSSCGDTFTDSEVPAKGHSFGVWTKLDNNQHQRVCANDSTHVEKANHTWNAGAITKDAKCEETGIRTYTCTTCNATRSETIQALGHTAPNGKGDCDRCGKHLKDVDSGSSTPAGACKYCGQVHTGPFGWLIKFFHSILALFGLRK